MQLPIIITDTIIRQDQQGRFCLNDLHKASGGEKRHQPANWLRMDQTLELIEELTVPQIRGTEQNQPVSVLQGGSNQGTYVCKELVYPTFRTTTNHDKIFKPKPHSTHTLLEKNSHGSPH